MPQQLNLDLPCVPALGRGDFMVAPSNALALTMIEGWQDWVAGKLVLTGPPGSGKTHLAHVFANAAQAQVVHASDLAGADIPALAQAAAAVEDVPQIAGDPASETALFHLHNLLLAEGHRLLLTGAGAVKHWGIALPDLASRLNAAPVASLLPPDDVLLAAVLAKLFADRQITPKPDVIGYLIRRMDRSFEAARQLVTEIDAHALSQQKPVTRSLVAAVLDRAS